jgi:hypothetical protein
MGLLPLVARLILAAGFAVVGLAELADLKASQRAVADFRLPNWAPESDRFHPAVRGAEHRNLAAPGAFSVVGTMWCAPLAYLHYCHRCKSAAGPQTRLSVLRTDSTETSMEI